MKKYFWVLIPISIVTIPLWFCLWYFNTWHQEVDSDCRGLTESGTALVTSVWYRGEIIESWYDDIETITDSIVLKRQAQSEKLYKTLKKTK